MITKTLLTTFLICLSLQQQVIDITEIQDGYDWLFNSQQFCQHKRAALTTDKPVYKIGETVYVTVYYYNVYTKAPLDRCQDNKYASLEVQDADDQYVDRVQRDTKNDDAIKDYSSFSYELKVDQEKFKGGVYKIKYNGNNKDQVKFFVLQYNNRKAGVVSNWNVETVKPGDLLKGQIVLKSFTKEQQFQNVIAQYSFLDATGNVLLQQNDVQVLNGRVDIEYVVPQNIGGLLILDIVFEADGIRVPYKKEFQEAQFDDIEIEFTNANGKVAINANNTFYFRAFKGEEKIFTTQIKNARVFRKIQNLNQVVINSVESNEEGMGKFSFFVSDQDIEFEALFVLQVKFSDFDIRNFIIFDTNGLKYSKISLQMDQRVFAMQDLIKFQLTNLQSDKDYSIVLQDKTKIYFEQIVQGERQAQRNFNVDIKKLGLPNGGVYTMQVYSQVSKEVKDEQQKNEDDQYIKEKENEQRESQLKRGVAEDRVRIYPVNPPKKTIQFLGDLDQEALIFIKPQYLLSADVQFDKNSYEPKDTVNFTVNYRQKCQHCPPENDNVRAIIEVVNSSAFVEADQSSTSASLFTKVFLEKEIYSEKNEFRNNQRYIDYLFNREQKNQANLNENDKRLELLLGNQKWRQLFLGLENLQNYQQNKWDKKYEKYRDSFEYLLPSSQGLLLTRVQYEAAPQIMFARAMPAPMMMKRQENLQVFDAMGGNEILVEEQEIMMEEQDQIVDDGKKNDSEKDEQKQLEDFLKQDNIYYQKATQFNEENYIKEKFQLPDGVQTFRMRITLYDQQGNYGVVYREITTKKDYNVYAEEPTFILSSETFRIKLVVENSTNKQETITFQKPFLFNVMVPAQSNQTYQISLSKNNVPFAVQAVNSRGENVADFVLSPAVIKNGIAISDGESQYISTQRGKQSVLKYENIVPQDLVSGETVMKVCYNNPGVGLILDAIEKMNRIPTGCFEQASSTNFPLVLALQIVLQLPETPRTKEIKNKLLENLKKGIKLLLTYETDDGGFEWFGKSPGHSTLTAYGLWQFREISNLNLKEDLFDKSLLQRLQNFLQKNKNQNGGWTITRGLDSLGNPPQNISDKYIAYVLSIQFAEIQQLFTEQFNSMDKELQKFLNGEKIESYQLALLGLYAKNKNDLVTAQKILDKLLSRQNKSEGYIQDSETSITRSKGNSLKVETTALTIMLFIEVNGSQIEQMQLMIEYLTKNLNNGYFGSTQATILSLLAFKKYLTEFTSNSEQDIVLNVSLNMKFVSQLRTNATDLLSQNSCVDISEEFKQVEIRGQKFEVTVEPNRNYLTQNNNRYLISIEHTYQQELPNSVQNSAIRANVVKREAQNTRIYELQVQNVSEEEQGMTVIEFNKPSCMDFTISELDNLKLQGFFDYFELLENNSKIVFYFKGLKPNQRKSFRFSLYKRFELNQCAERTHVIYLYYDKDGSVQYKRAD